MRKEDGRGTDGMLGDYTLDCLQIPILVGNTSANPCAVHGVRGWAWGLHSYCPPIVYRVHYCLLPDTTLYMDNGSIALLEHQLLRRCTGLEHHVVINFAAEGPVASEHRDDHAGSRIKQFLFFLLFLFPSEKIIIKITNKQKHIQDKKKYRQNV